MATKVLRSRRVLLLGGLTLVVLVGVVAAIAVLRTGNDQAEPAEPALPGIGVSAPEFRDAYNQAARQTGADPIRAPVWSRDDTLQLDVAEQRLGDWGLIEMYRDPEGALTAFTIVARAETPERQQEFRSHATAAISSSLGVAAEDAETIFDHDLGAATMERPLDQVVERNEVRLRLLIGDSWQFSITSIAAP